MTFDVRTDPRDGSVDARSSIRLPFEPKGWLCDFRATLAAACRTLVASSGEILHATYTSDERGPVDVENVLTYNLGTGAIAAAARHGLMLERSFRRAGPTPEDAHHYRYCLASAAAPWTHWRSGQPLAALRVSAGDGVFSSGKAGRWWLAARRGDITAHVRATTTPDRYTLRLTVSPPDGWRGSLVGLLKPLTDGLVAAMHAHEGPVDPAVLARATMIDDSLTPDDLRVLLGAPTAPLGRVRLVVPRAAGVMWLPADDGIVALDLRLTTDEPPGTVRTEAALAVPTHS